MTEIKPVYQWQHSNRGVLPESWWKDCTEEDFKARDNKMQFNVRIMFETTAVIESLRRDNEALQKENAEWKTVLDCNEQIRVAQAKRIEELEAATDHLGLTPQQASDGLARYKAQVAEIESLRKQVEELLGASRMAITALAHTSQKNELYDEAYKRLDSAISFISASKNGE